MSESATQPPPNYLGAPASHWVGELGSDDPLKRRLAAYALGMIGPAGASASMPALTKAIAQDPASFVRVWASAALAKIEPGDERAVEGLRAATHDELNFVRSLGAWFLGRIGPRLEDKDQAVAELERLRDDDDPSVRAEANVALHILKHKNVRARS